MRMGITGPEPNFINAQVSDFSLTLNVIQKSPKVIKNILKSEIE
jgi:hypothetical protein